MATGVARGVYARSLLVACQGKECMKELKRIGIASSAKVTGVLTAIFGLFAGIAFALFASIGGGMGSFGGVAGLLIGLIGVPILYGLIGVVAGALYAALYNLIAGLIGGIKIELE